MVPEDPTARAIVHGLFDLIVGSDLLYDRGSGVGLAAFIARHAAVAAEVWIVDPDRSNRSPFVRDLAASGFERREERLDRAATTTVDAYKGRLLIFTRGFERGSGSSPPLIAKGATVSPVSLAASA